MSTEPEKRSEVHNAIAQLAVKTSDSRLKTIVADETVATDIRSACAELLSARCALGLNRACDIRDRARMYRAVLAVLEEQCTSRALDDEEDRAATARAIAVQLVPGTFVDLSEHDDELEALDPHEAVKQ